MKLYKFRGKDRYDNFHYGSLVQEFSHFGDETVVRCYIIENAGNNKREEEFFVDNDSVAQLVGYDSFGDEVYEGDTSTIAKHI